MCYTKTASGRCMRASAGCRNLFYQNHCRIPCGIHSVFSNTFIFDAENEGKEGYLYSLVTTSIIQGIKSIPVYVEADVSDGMPLFEMVGSLSPEVKESKERVRTALKNTGYILPPKRITTLDEKKDQTEFWVVNDIHAQDSIFRLLPQYFVPLVLCRRKR